MLIDLSALINILFILIFFFNPWDTVFAIPGFDRIKLFCWFEFEIRSALWMQPWPIGAFLVTVALYVKFANDSSFASAVYSIVLLLLNHWCLHIQWHLVLHHLFVFFFLPKDFFQKSLGISDYRDVFIIAIFGGKLSEFNFVPWEIVSWQGNSPFYVLRKDWDTKFVMDALNLLLLNNLALTFLIGFLIFIVEGIFIDGAFLVFNLNGFIHFILIWLISSKYRKLASEAISFPSNMGCICCFLLSLFGSLSSINWVCLFSLSWWINSHYVYSHFAIC